MQCLKMMLSVQNQQHQNHHPYLEAENDSLLVLAEQEYNAGSYNQALEHCIAVHERSPNRTDALNLLGAIHHQLGRLQEAVACCQRALTLNPLLVDVHNNLGNILLAQGLAQDAYDCYAEAIRIQPTFAVAWSNLAGLLMDAGDYERAFTYSQEALKLSPNFLDAHINMGNVLKGLGKHQEAKVFFLRAIQLRPDCANAYKNLANVYYEQRQLDQAILHYHKAIMLNPSYYEAYNNLGRALNDAGRLEEAIACYNYSLELQVKRPQDLANPKNIRYLSIPYNNLAIIYIRLGQYAKAIACYNEVLRINPAAADELVYRGNIHLEVGRVIEAIQDYLHAIHIKPNMAEAHARLALAYKESGDAEAAIMSYKQALLLKPDFPDATCQLFYTLQSVCDWDDWKRKFQEVEDIVKRQSKMQVLSSVLPFQAMVSPLDGSLALDISRKFAKNVASRFPMQSFDHPPALRVKGPGGCGRLRVGYVSSDFGDHPLSHLMGSVFGMHNRENIEVFCFALSQDDESELRLRISTEAEHFTDVSAWTSDAIAKMISDNQIQVLVNLNGYTKGGRTEIFALKPAPIQASYMGFASTMGAEYIDYLVADELVCPTENSHFYSEKLVHLPHCYFVNDYKQINRDILDTRRLPKRSDYNLPENKFLFACFNQLYKIDPETFTAWCRILKRVPNSALWLLRFPAAGEARLRAFSAAQGVAPDQIIFTNVTDKNEHIRRSTLADLFLDTPHCNGHTTGTDALWAGLPMITLPLEKMATRVAMSLCYAAGFGKEMVVNSIQEYEERAVMLAQNPKTLGELTSRLRAARLTCPLFDTQRWVTNLERAYFKMWSLHCDGNSPQTFRITEQDPIHDGTGQ